MLTLALLWAAPAVAWEFSAEPLCKVTHDDGALAFEMTFDGAHYTLALSRAAGWSGAPVFAMRFEPLGPSISTRSHVIEGQTLRVTDSGFGNVLNGLEFNSTGFAELGSDIHKLDLAGAAPAIAAFRSCEPLPSLS